MEFTRLEDVHFRTFFYLAVNRLIAHKSQNILYLITEYSDFIEYTVNKQGKII